MSIRDAADLFHRINRLAGEADWTDAELREALVGEGINPSVFLDRIRSDVKTLLRDSPLYWRNRASALRSKLVASVLTAQRRRTRKLPRKELLVNIEATLARMPPELIRGFAFEHRNFETCSEEDLESILLELECIEDLDIPNASE